MFLGLNSKGYCFGYTEVEVKKCFRQNRFRSVRPIHCIGPSDAMDLISTFCLNHTEIKTPKTIRLGKFTHWKQWRKVMSFETMPVADDQNILIRFTFHERDGNTVQFADGITACYPNSYELSDCDSANIVMSQLGYILLYSYKKSWFIRMYPDGAMDYRPYTDEYGKYSKLARIEELTDLE